MNTKYEDKIYQVYIIRAMSFEKNRLFFVLRSKPFNMFYTFKTKLKIFESSMQFDVLFISGVVRTWFYTNIVNNVHVLWNMVAYYCHHLSDNYVDLSDLYVVVSLIYLLENESLKTCSCPINSIQTTTKLSDKST